MATWRSGADTRDAVIVGASLAVHFFSPRPAVDHVVACLLGCYGRWQPGRRFEQVMLQEPLRVGQLRKPSEKGVLGSDSLL
jgi:hypothetical protein